MKLFWKVILTPQYNSIDCDEMELDNAVSDTNTQHQAENISFSSKSAISLKSDISSSESPNTSRKRSSPKCKEKRRKKGAVGQEEMPTNPKPLSADPNPVLQSPDIR